MSDSAPRYTGPDPTDRLMTRDEVKARFDRETAVVYSGQGPAHLPGYAEALALVVESLHVFLPSQPRILDLGAGTGNLSREVLAAFPEAYVVLLDFSPNMLVQSRRVLTEFAGRYDIACADFFEWVFSTKSFHGIVSSFAIHHARGESEYMRLYDRIATWLAPGGVFVCCDVVAGANAKWTAINEEGWRRHLQAHFDPAIVEQVFANYRSEDTPISLVQHMALLHQVGFAHVDVLWKKHNFAVYAAQVARG